MQGFDVRCFVLLQVLASIRADVGLLFDVSASLWADLERIQ